MVSPVFGSGVLSFTAGNHAKHPLNVLCGGISFGRGALNCVSAIGVVDTTTKRYGVRRAVRPRASVGCSTFPKGREAKPKTELALRVFSFESFGVGYRPKIVAVLTTLATAPNPRVVK